MFDALVADARTAVDAVVPGDVAHTLSDDDLLAGVRTLETARTLLDSAEGVLLAELAARGTPDRRHGLRTAGWVARTCGGTRGRVTARIQVGTRLRTLLHHTEAALAAKWLSTGVGRDPQDRAAAMLGHVSGEHRPGVEPGR